MKSRIPSEPFRPIVRAAILLFAIGVAGVIGFKAIGGSEHGWLDALYMTVITLTTVGFGETIPVTDPAHQVMVIVLLMAGVGTFLYFFSNVTAFFVEGTLDRMFWRRRMARERARMRDHFIVVGGGHTGEHVLAELLETGRGVVLVERDEERIKQLHARHNAEFPVVVGDGTDDAVLEEAGLLRAVGLVTCMSSDKDNLLVTFSARNIRPDLRIVARCMDDSQTGKLRKAGADAVVSPNHIGGLRLVSELVRPTVVGFLDVMLRDKDRRFRVEEVLVHEDSDIDGATVGSVRERDIDGLVLVALRDADGGWHLGPPASRVIAAGERIVIIGDPGVRYRIEAAAGHGAKTSHQ